MDRLRAECPWDREQTHRSLAAYLLEETYEMLEAIDTGRRPRPPARGARRPAAAGGASTRGSPRRTWTSFTIDDVAGDIVEKLVHRHPHVFAGVEGADRDGVEANWETIKAAEKGRASVLDGIPRGCQPWRWRTRCSAGPCRLGVPALVGAASDLGDQLLALVVKARAAGLDPEQELRGAVRRLAEAVRAAER